MYKKALNIGIIIGINGFLYWLVAFISSPISEGLLKIMDVASLFLWVYINYKVIKTVGISFTTAFLQLYAFTLLVLAFGIIGELFSLPLFSSIFAVYFMPFFDVSIYIFSWLSIKLHYLLNPIIAMFILSSVTLGLSQYKPNA